MHNFFNIVFFIILLVSTSQKIDYPTKRGRPTTKGINMYVQNNKYIILKEFEQFVNDTIILDVEISTDDLSNYTGYDSLDLAYHFTYPDGTDEIIIDNQEKFIAYDINDVSKLKKINLSSYNSFVKTAIMHELCHSYFLQNIIKSAYNNKEIYKEYDFRQRSQLKMYPNPEQYYGAEFIEEGFCQYIIEKMKLQIAQPTYTPKTINNLSDETYIYNIKYVYSADFVRPILDSLGLKDGVFLLISNKPPTYEEILNPTLFLKRLK